MADDYPVRDTDDDAGSAGSRVPRRRSRSSGSAAATAVGDPELLDPRQADE